MVVLVYVVLVVLVYVVLVVLVYVVFVMAHDDGVYNGNAALRCCRRHFHYCYYQHHLQCFLCMGPFLFLLSYKPPPS